MKQTKVISVNTLYNYIQLINNYNKVPTTILPPFRQYSDRLQDCLFVQGLSKNTTHSWEINSHEGLVPFEFYMDTDHCCFMTLH
jgi:hypothetical protein